MSSAQSRSTLADRQRQLVESLVSDGPLPPSFDEAQVSRTRVSLARKRSRGVAKACRSLKEKLGDRFEDFFAEYAVSVMPPSRGGGVADGEQFVEWLKRTGRWH